MINAKQSHRDLDGYVGGMIMGLKQITWKDNNRLKENGLVYMAHTSWQTVPFYTLHISPAWQIVKKLEPGFNVLITNDTCCFVNKETSEVFKCTGFMPYAISMAALNAVGYKKQ